MLQHALISRQDSLSYPRACKTTLRAETPCHLRVSKCKHLSCLSEHVLAENACAVVSLFLSSYFSAAASSLWSLRCRCCFLFKKPLTFELLQRRLYYFPLWSQSKSAGEQVSHPFLWDHWGCLLTLEHASGCIHTHVSVGRDNYYLPLTHALLLIV